MWTARGVSDSEVRVNAEPADAVGGRSRMLARERGSGQHEELVLWLEDRESTLRIWEDRRFLPGCFAISQSSA